MGGLSSRPFTGDNGIHGSASAFEGLAERINWLDASIDEDQTGKALLRAGIKKEILAKWCKDPQVESDGEMKSLFDTLEDLSIPETIKMAQKLGGDPFEFDESSFSTNQAFLFIKPHANTSPVREFVKSYLEGMAITILEEGE